MGPAGPWGGGCSWREKLRSKEVTGLWQRSIPALPPAAYVATLQEPSDPCSGWGGGSYFSDNSSPGRGLPHSGLEDHSKANWLAGGRTTQDNTGTWFTCKDFTVYRHVLYSCLRGSRPPSLEQEPPGDSSHGPGPLASSCPRHLPSHQPLCSVPGGGGGERTDAASPVFLGDPGSRSLPRNQHLLGSHWLGTVGGTSPYSQAIIQGLSPAEFFLSFLVCLLCLPSDGGHRAATSLGQSPVFLWSFQAQQAPPRASQWTLISPACSGCWSPAATSPSMPQFPPTSVGGN